jgi:hypothetical protein
VRPNNGLKNLICASSSFWASLLLIIQTSLPYHSAALEGMLCIHNFVSIVMCFPKWLLIISFIFYIENNIIYINILHH